MKQMKQIQQIQQVANEVRQLVIDPTTKRSKPVCHEAAEEIVLRLAQVGISAKNIWGYVKLPDRLLRHHWVKVGRVIIDVTIDQIAIADFPAVYIGTKPSNYYTDKELTAEKMKEWTFKPAITVGEVLDKCGLLARPLRAGVTDEEIERLLVSVETII